MIDIWELFLPDDRPNYDRTKKPTSLKNFTQEFYTSYPFKRQPHKMVKHIQSIRRLSADELFECVWPCCGVGA